MVHGMAREYDGMEMASVESSRRLGRGRTRVNIGKVVWQPSEDGRFGWFEPQNHRAGSFPGLDLQTRGKPGAVGASRRRAHGVIAKLASEAK